MQADVEKELSLFLEKDSAAGPVYFNVGIFSRFKRLSVERPDDLSLARIDDSSEDSRMRVETDSIDQRLNGV